jgi:hypothetical protein
VQEFVFDLLGLQVCHFEGQPQTVLRSRHRLAQRRIARPEPQAVASGHQNRLSTQFALKDGWSIPNVAVAKILHLAQIEINGVDRSPPETDLHADDYDGQDKAKRANEPAQAEHR